MITLDKALTQFTDSLNIESMPDMTYYEANMAPDEYEEFLELSRCIVAIQSTKIANEFEKMFIAVDDLVKSSYGPAGAANFKSAEKEVDQTTQDRINKLFDEEF